MEDIYNQFRDFKSFEVVFIDKNGNPQKIFCTVSSIGNDSIVIDSNNEKNKHVTAEKGDELKLHIYTENGIYTATSKVLETDKGIINTEYVIAYPANSKHSQRREYFRAEMNIDFKLNVISEDQPEDNFSLAAKTKNICGKGMSFVYNRDFPKYDSIEIELFFIEKNIKTMATLVYSKQIVFGTQPKYILAFTFNDILSKDIDFIVKKCFLHQLALRKKHIE